MNTVSTRDFVYRNKAFVGFISDLGSGFDFAHRDGYVGLTLQSHLTNCIADYFVYSPHTGNDNGITFWTLLPTLNTLRDLPALKGTRILLYND